jgi:hypothetical protein
MCHIGHVNSQVSFPLAVGMYIGFKVAVVFDELLFVLVDDRFGESVGIDDTPTPWSSSFSLVMPAIELSWFSLTTRDCNASTKAGSSIELISILVQLGGRWSYVNVAVVW